MPARKYDLGRRSASAARTRETILAATRRLVTDRPAHQVSVGQVARAAGVSRITVYNAFGSKAGLLHAVAAAGAAGTGTPDLAEPRDALRRRVLASCERWAAEPGFHRNLHPAGQMDDLEGDRALAERLAAADQLRPGCSIKEAEDVIAAVTSFAVFDRLHKDGRRSPAAVAEVVMRLASTVLA